MPLDSKYTISSWGDSLPVGEPFFGMWHEPAESSQKICHLERLRHRIKLGVTQSRVVPFLPGVITDWIRGFLPFSPLPKIIAIVDALLSLYIVGRAIQLDIGKADVAFKILDLPAQRRLRYIQRLRRPPKMKFLGRL